MNFSDLFSNISDFFRLPRTKCSRCKRPYKDLIIHFEEGAIQCVGCGESADIVNELGREQAVLILDDAIKKGSLTPESLYHAEQLKKKIEFGNYARLKFSSKHAPVKETVSQSFRLTRRNKMAAINQKIVPHLWYDREAREAANFYCSVFPDSRIDGITTLPNTPSGDCDVVTFSLWGYSLMAISAGPVFTFNPSVSFMVNFDPAQDKDAKTRIDEIWAKLSEGGKVLMPLDKYHFSERYGWIQDKYGLSWQLILTDPKGKERPPIIPSLLFVGDVYNKAEEASDFYISVFKNSKRGEIARYPAGMEPDKEGALMFTDFMLEGQWFVAMDSGLEHGFAFNEAVSFIVNCEDQNEIDYYWEKLSDVPEAEECGWLKDKYGLSWQVSPAVLNEMMLDRDAERLDRITQAFLKMKKFDIDELQRAYEGK